MFKREKINGYTGPRREYRQGKHKPNRTNPGTAWKANRARAERKRHAKHCKRYGHKAVANV